jgi:hypothetical protein
MKTKRLLIASLIGLAVIILPILLTGCSSGVSQEEYQNLSNQLATARTELETLKAQQGQSQQSIGKTNAYADIMDMCLEPWLVLVGEKSKRGYTAADTIKWVGDLDTRIKAIDDAALTTLWKGYVNTTNNAEKTKIGVQLMSYVSGKVLAGTK